MKIAFSSGRTDRYGCRGDQHIVNLEDDALEFDATERPAAETTQRIADLLGITPWMLRSKLGADSKPTTYRLQDGTSPSAPRLTSQHQ